MGQIHTFSADVLGGSTYSFEVWEGHPFEETVLALLSQHRTELSKLREAVERFNQNQGMPDDYTEVVVYFGQSVRSRENRQAQQEES